MLPPPRTETTPDLHVTATSVSGRFASSATSHVVLLVDGVPLATAPVVPGAHQNERWFELPLPAHVLGTMLDVVGAETGQSVLPAPFDLAAARGLRWQGWSLDGGQIEGRFTLEGPAAAPGAAIPVDILSSDAWYGRAYALPGPSGYRFATTVTHLPLPAEPALIMPRVGGIAVPDPLVLSCKDLGFAGATGGGTAPRVEGWAIDTAHRNRRVRVDIRVGGLKLGTVLADRMRPDVKPLRLGDGRCGFSLPFPRGIPLEQDQLVEVLIAGTTLHLRGSPYVRPASKPFTGFFDGVNGPFVTGWVVDMRNPDQPVRVEAVHDGRVIGSGLASLYRDDVEKAGLPTARCGFRFLLERPVTELFETDIAVRIAGTGEVLQGSPRRVSQNPNITRFLKRTARIKSTTSRRLARRMSYQTRDTLISIIMPVFDTPEAWLVQALDSVRRQWSANWELICVNDGSTQPHVRPLLDSYAKRDARIRVLHAPVNRGIAAATNFGLRAAHGSYVAFMDHDDVLEPDAVYELALAAQQTGAELIYSDEALTAGDIGSVIDVRARPAFSHDYYLSHPYFVHMVCVRTETARKLAGWDESLAISADVDFVLRVIEAARTVAHVPKVLYRWRTHEASAGHAKRAEVSRATQAALARHLDRLGRGAAVSEGLGFNEYRVDWPDDGGEVLVVIPTKNRVDLLRTCIDSIERTSPGEALRIVVIDHQSTDPKTVRYLGKIAERHTVMPYAGPFNYARMNNLAVRTHGGRAKYVLFLNNDVEAREPGWIARLRSLANRPEVGAVGPLLLYGDDRVQHGGVIVGFSDAADHAMKFANAYAVVGKRNPGYNCSLTVVRDYSAVTAACMMMRRSVFTRLRGFDEKFAIGFNDTDLCLRARAAGFRVLYDGFTVLYHHESATRTQTKAVDHPEDDVRLRKRWKAYFRDGDPFYSPLLSPSGTDHTLRTDPGCKGRMAARTVRLRQ